MDTLTDAGKDRCINGHNACLDICTGASSMLKIATTHIYLMNKSYAFMKISENLKFGNKIIEAFIMSDMKGSMYL
jgi:hypothetical protein